MSHFYASIQGDRGPATRGGSKRSGIEAHPRGWNIGVRVTAYHDAETETDYFLVYATNGSNGLSGGYHEELIATIKNGCYHGIPDIEHFGVVSNGG